MKAFELVYLLLSLSPRGLPAISSEPELFEIIRTASGSIRDGLTASHGYAPYHRWIQWSVK